MKGSTTLSISGLARSGQGRFRSRVWGPKNMVGSEVNRLAMATSTATRPAVPQRIQVRLGAGIGLEQSELTPGLAATLRHAASMRNPVFDKRQRMRAGPP
jgi:hypothetical protein